MSTGKRFALIACAVATLCCIGILTTSAQEAAAQPWQKLYTGKEATGENVIALWQFDSGAEKKDASGKGHAVALRGESRIAPEGRFGSCLESFPAKEDKAQGAVSARRPELSPQGPFSLELWIKPKPAMKEAKSAFLLDNKYYHYKKALAQANSGYVFWLTKAKDRMRPTVMLGFGKDSEYFRAKPVTLEAGTWYHIAFTYDGAGTGRLFLNGSDVGGKTYEGLGAISPAKYPLAVGARYGSTHVGFPGYIDQVRISKGVVKFQPAE